MKERGRCLGCAFYLGDDQRGECRFFPPISTVGFAKVSPQAWCSRFRRELGDLFRQTAKFQEVQDE